MNVSICSRADRCTSNGLITVCAVLLVNTLGEATRGESKCSIQVNLKYHDGVPGISEDAFQEHVVPRLLSALVLHEMRKELAHSRYGCFCSFESQKH